MAISYYVFYDVVRAQFQITGDESLYLARLLMKPRALILENKLYLDDKDNFSGVLDNPQCFGF